MYWVSVVTEAGIFAILALGLDVIWGWGGDFDLAFYGYLALGSYLTFVLTIGKPTPPVEYILGYHLPVVLAIVLAMVVVVGLAAVIGAIALRNLREIYFAVTTLGAVSALYLLVENYTPLFDGYNGVYGLINPGQTALNLTYNGYRIFFLGVVLVLLLAAYLIVQRLSRSPFGRMLRSVREDERAAAAYGRQVFSAKYRAYLFGAALAGLTGGLFAIFISAFNPSAWTPQELLVIYAAILVGGRGNPRGVILGVFVVYIGFIELTRYLPSPASRPDFGPAMRQILIGLMIILMLRFRPEGLFRERPGLDRSPIVNGAPIPASQRPAAPPGLRSDEGATREGGASEGGMGRWGGGPEASGENRASRGQRMSVLLEIESLTKFFGGVHAVRNCTFSVPEGQVTGLIGPNGAGKSTVVDLATGFGRPDSGSVRFAGEPIIGKRPDVISRLGLIRTFQTPREWRQLTVMDNVLLARRRFAQESLWRSITRARRIRREEEADRAAVRDILERFQLAGLKNELAVRLSGGQKRLLEFARIAAAEARLIILDEPMGGVNPVLGARIGEAVREFAAEGRTVVVVEHNLPFIEKTCHQVVVMDLGEVIATGTVFRPA